MDWTGKARTNYFRIDESRYVEMVRAMEFFGIDVEPHDAERGYVMLTPIKDVGDGGWPSCISTDEKRPDVDEFGSVQFSFENHVMPFVVPGEVVVAQSFGSEASYYLDGHASAFKRNEDGTVRRVDVDLSDIYGLAAKRFGVDEARIARATNNDLPELMDAPHRVERER